MTELLDGHGRPLLDRRRSTVRLPGGEAVTAQVAGLDCQWAIAMVLVDSLDGEPVPPMMATLGIPADFVEMVEVKPGDAPIITLRADPSGPDGEHVFLAPATAVAILCDTLRRQNIPLPEGYPTRIPIEAEPVSDGD